ncbi:glyoxylase-like metal-dependent hydrolase (beta-lactamase superfamily II) [Caulobacter ginsengisoli]|uniref:Glyoxylase-like metal-dependent hydrolase (Beta-lactamase superfamily II) n=1 Tax=Caulobacter ginsengisoli TaxID=400775 RepID=A0ABU0ITZ1_9CAUL|nr:MBL fold metallo-hydrolase [Caulobacter ginsengisoli]MDQ0465477.1 glyoxylase-like metal-dependent hydrolase (beta-lactamase superfamily II) [Caulobacter ginsengisoli]
MLRWQIGDVTVTRVLEIEMPVPYHDKHPFLAGATPDALAEIPWLSPHYVTPDGALRLSIHALLVEAPGLRLVVDTCIGNDRPRRMTGRQPLSTGFLAEMEKAGWARDSVDAVVCTHLHVDHVGWNTMLVDGAWVPTFPRARYLIGRKEYDYWKAEGDEDQQVILGDSIQPIFDAGLAELVESDHRLSAEVALKPTPGHTPGHVSVAIESKGQRALITGDIMHHPCQVARPDWAPPFDADVAQSLATRQAVLSEVGDSDILVIGTHFAAPTAGLVVRDGETWRFEGAAG